MTDKIRIVFAALATLTGITLAEFIRIAEGNK